jgi:anaerobic selenocysteine-containing dehydrogenase
MTLAPSVTHTVHGTCHHDCPDSCGWTVSVTDGVAVQLRGNPAHPYSAGELCPKVNRFLDRVYSPDRITTPLRRVGPKGEGRFEPITWDEALRRDRRPPRRDRRHRRPRRRSCRSSAPATRARSRSSSSSGSGTASVRRTHVLGALCGAVAGAGTASTLGTGKARSTRTDLRHSKLVLLWGTNTRLTNRHLWPSIEGTRRGRTGRGDRPDPHDHRRERRLVRAAAVPAPTSR